MAQTTSAENPQAAIAVIVAHSSVLMREIIGSAVSDPDQTVVASCGTLADLDSAAHRFHPQVAIVSADFDHDELVQRIPSLVSGGTRVLIVSDGAADQSTSKLLLAGASGLLLVEDTALSEIPDAVKAVASGRTALHPDVALAVFEQWRAMTAKEVSEPRVKISAREGAVLEAVARGLTTREISRSLGIAEKTVESHKSKLYAKLGAKNQAHAVALASELGLIALV